MSLSFYATVLTTFLLLKIIHLVFPSLSPLLFTINILLLVYLLHFISVPLLRGVIRVIAEMEVSAEGGRMGAVERVWSGVIGLLGLGDGKEEERRGLLMVGDEEDDDDESEEQVVEREEGRFHQESEIKNINENAQNTSHKPALKLPRPSILSSLSIGSYSSSSRHLEPSPPTHNTNKPRNPNRHVHFAFSSHEEKDSRAWRDSHRHRRVERRVLEPGQMRGFMQGIGEGIGEVGLRDLKERQRKGREKEMEEMEKKKAESDDEGVD